RAGHAAARGDAYACNQLVHGERLHEVVVRSDVERADAVLLAPASADDDDRRADSLAPRGLDQRPPVELRKHQVEDAHVWLLVAKTLEAGPAARDPVGLETRGAKVTRHPVGDDLVVLDNQNPGHRRNPASTSARDGFAL